MKQIISKTIESVNPVLWTIDRNPANHQELILAGADKIIMKFHLNLTSNQLELCDKSEEIHQKSIRDVKFSSDGSFIAAASFDGSVSIWTNSSDLGRYSMNFIFISF
jgi:WD40 repeat protein